MPFTTHCQSVLVFTLFIRGGLLQKFKRPIISHIHTYIQLHLGAEFDTNGLVLSDPGEPGHLLSFCGLRCQIRLSKGFKPLDVDSRIVERDGIWAQRIIHAASDFPSTSSKALRMLGA